MSYKAIRATMRAHAHDSAHAVVAGLRQEGCFAGELRRALIHDHNVRNPHAREVILSDTMAYYRTTLAHLRADSAGENPG